jgi:hypothetical protein
MTRAPPHRGLQVARLQAQPAQRFGVICLQRAAPVLVFVNRPAAQPIQNCDVTRHPVNKLMRRQYPDSLFETMKRVLESL